MVTIIIFGMIKNMVSEYERYRKTSWCTEIADYLAGPLPEDDPNSSAPWSGLGTVSSNLWINAFDEADRCVNNAIVCYEDGLLTKYEILMSALGATIIGLKSRGYLEARVAVEA